MGGPALVRLSPSNGDLALVFAIPVVQAIGMNLDDPRRGSDPDALEGLTEPPGRPVCDRRDHAPHITASWRRRPNPQIAWTNQVAGAPPCCRVGRQSGGLFDSILLGWVGSKADHPTQVGEAQRLGMRPMTGLGASRGLVPLRFQNVLC